MNVKNLVETKLNEMRRKNQVGDGPGGIQLFWINEKDFSIAINNKRYAYVGVGDVESFLASLEGGAKTVDEIMAEKAVASEKEEMESKGKPMPDPKVVEVKSASSDTVRSLDLFLSGEKITDECSFEKTGVPSKRNLLHKDVQIGEVINGNPVLSEESKTLGYEFTIDEKFPREKLNTEIKEPEKPKRGRPKIK